MLPMHSQNYLVKLAICCVSFFLFVISFSLNEFFYSFALYAPGINLIFLPAGFKLLCILLGGKAAVVGLLLSSVYVSMRVWDNTAVMQMVYFAFAGVGSYYVAVSLVKKLMGIDNTLSNLRYLHIIILSAAVSFTNGAVHNLVYVWQDKVNWGDFFAHATAMVVGDFLGCFVVIVIFNICIDLAFKLMRSERSNETKGISRFAHFLNTGLR
jgi:hypothetical protein